MKNKLYIALFAVVVSSTTVVSPFTQDLMVDNKTGLILGGNPSTYTPSNTVNNMLGGNASTYAPSETENLINRRARQTQEQLKDLASFSKKIENFIKDQASFLRRVYIDFTDLSQMLAKEREKNLAVFDEYFSAPMNDNSDSSTIMPLEMESSDSGESV